MDRQSIIQCRQRLVFALFLTIVFLLAVLGAIIKNTYFDNSSSNQIVAQPKQIPSSDFAQTKPKLNWQTFESTSYGPPWDSIQGTGTTSTGIVLEGPACVIAVDPSVIPYHSKVLVRPNPHRTCKNYSAEDTGGAIVGNRIDFYDWRGRTHQYAWGRQNVHLAILKQ